MDLENIRNKQRNIKIELKLTNKQKIQINKTIGTERFIYNIYLPNNLDKKWIKDVSSKSIKQAIIYGERAFKNFFKGLSSFLIFKKKGKNELGAYFVKNNKKDFEFYRHKI